MWEEYPKKQGIWCKGSEFLYDFCDGTREDCLKKGMEKCKNDSDCYGVVFNSGQAKKFKGVGVCWSPETEAKALKDWDYFAKTCKYF